MIVLSLGCEVIDKQTVNAIEMSVRVALAGQISGPKIGLAENGRLSVNKSTRFQSGCWKPFADEEAIETCWSCRRRHYYRKLETVR